MSKITEKMIINAPGKSVVLDGVDFTGKGYIDVQAADEVVLRNCRVYGITPTGAAKDYWLKVIGDIPVKIVIEHCFFGKNDDKMYNLFEMNAKLKDGSSFSDNYFTKSCSHNFINVYGADEGAVIDINDNVFEYSYSGIRIGVKGEPECRINMARNVVMDSERGDYEGVALAQPYGTSTTSFANMTIVLNGNTCVGEQQFYAYSGSKDTMMDESTMPKVIINGKIANVPIYH